MYKLELICVKYVPIALITLIDVILYYFDIDFELINYIAGTSFLTMIPMYISSYVYKFCEYHRYVSTLYYGKANAGLTLGIIGTALGA